jgi:hypothetical protein
MRAPSPGRDGEGGRAVKTAWAIVMSMLLVLLATGAAHSQAMRSGGSGGIGGGRPAARPSTGAMAPGFVPRGAPSSRFVQGQGFGHHTFARQPFFARSPVFFRSGRFPFRSGFVGGPVYFFGGGTVVAPWPYWYAYPSPGYAPPQYWAYCRSPEGHYPYVQDCPGGWVPVLPTPPPPDSWQSAPDSGPAPMGGTTSEDIREQIARSQADTSGQLDVSLEPTAGPQRSP